MKGFTIFFAMLIASLALAVGLSIFDLTVRELDLSSTVKQSELAFFAADTGAECALYWDQQFRTVAAGDGDGSGFATSTQYTLGSSGSPGSGVDVPAGSLTCNGQDIVAANNPYIFNTVANNNTGWAITPIDATHASTEFWISLGNSSADPCVQVFVQKSGNPAATTISSYGYNTCGTGLLKIERALQVNY